MSQQNESSEMKALRAAKDAAAKVTTYEQQLRARHTTLVKERTLIASQFRSLDEVLASKNRLVDEAAARWAERNALTLVSAVNGYQPPGEDDPIARRQTRKPQLPRLTENVNWRMDLEDLCGMAPDVVKARLELVIRESGARFGLPAEARVAKLAELDGQILDLERSHTELVDAAGEAGITLPLLDAVRARREGEASKAERDQALAAERAAGIYAVARM